MSSQLQNAISYLNKCGIVHRDIKLDNILCMRDSACNVNIKLIDFGFGTFIYRDQKLNEGVGTLNFLAPEIVNRDEILREQHIFLRSIFIKSKYELVSLNLCLFLFYIGLIFSLNAIFYFDSSISERYHNKGKVPIIENLLRSIYSYLISFILLKLVSFLKFYAPIFDVFALEIKNANALGKYFIKGLHIVKRKLFIFFIAIIFFSLFFLYYLTLFCYIYTTIQMSWFIGAWVSLGISFAVTFIYAFIFSILKVIALKCKIRSLYNLLLFIYYIY